MEAIEHHCNTETGQRLSDADRYRPISLLCRMYKLYERLILNRIAPSDRHQINEQADFRPRKSCSQLLNLTQHIDDGYQRGMIIGTEFVDLYAAYDTVNNGLFIQNLYDFTEDIALCRVIQIMLSSRRLYVELNNNPSRWRNQKNGVSQCTISNTV